MVYSHSSKLFFSLLLHLCLVHTEPISSVPILMKISFDEGYYTHIFEDSTFMLQHEGRKVHISQDETTKVVAAVEVHRAVSPLESYWLSVLPNTTMPNAIRNLIDPVSYIRSTFFLLKNMYPRAQMNQGINFDRTIVGAAFIPRTEADHLKFSSENLHQILDHFSMVTGSGEAKQIEKIIKDCEEPCLIGENKFCSTSLELMIDSVVSLLGTSNIKALSTTVHQSNMIAQQGKASYTITSPIKKIPYHSRLVVCHQVPSPQAVHYCHTNIAYEGYVVSLVGKDGSKVNAVALCHHDIVNFDRLFLELLDLEPGSVQPVCHFLPENLLWVSREDMSKAVLIY